MYWGVIVNIAPRTIKGTDGCHEYVFCWSNTRQEAQHIADRINTNGKIGVARVERERKEK